jgi:hypothetical protein
VAGIVRKKDKWNGGVQPRIYQPGDIASNEIGVGGFGNAEVIGDEKILPEREPFTCNP